MTFLNLFVDELIGGRVSVAEVFRPPFFYVVVARPFQGRIARLKASCYNGRIVGVQNFEPLLF